MRILIAEDDQVLADALLRSLRTSGSAVDHVATGTQADAALMTNSEFDLLILDLGLPNLHGLEILKRLRARGRTFRCLCSPRQIARRRASGAWTMAPTTAWPSPSAWSSRHA